VPVILQECCVSSWFQWLLNPPGLRKAALQVTVEVLMLPDRNEVDDIPLVINDVGDEPLVVLGLEFLHPNISKRTTLPVASVWILENLCLHFVKPADNGWREAFAIFVVTWGGEPRIRHLPPSPLYGLSEPRFNFSCPFQDLLDQLERQIGVILGDHGQLDVSACLLAQRPMLPLSPRCELALQTLVNPQIQCHHHSASSDPSPRPQES